MATICAATAQAMGLAEALGLEPRLFLEAINPRSAQQISTERSTRGEDVARDLGLWGIATNLPNVVAPLVGGWMIEYFHGTRAGYQAVFALAGLSFALASLTVLLVGRTPLSPMWALPGALRREYLDF